MNGEYSMSGQGSTANVIAGLASFFYPGLGQLVQGRFLAAAIFFVAGTLLWFVLLGWIMHLWAAINAARYQP
jgi:TM2 domain-containing membrane protein YozV